uniref:ribosomal protein L32 n=1 Tax=Fibrocapsa japonica TaxID=94617 RepID=UPI002114CA8E|nr:ribosomal protein L32 [Fibrocapsa japonica]YP_010444219.1 ribosomal protein L32 [Fibrocapsa japonica]UTE95083.1 ribosomal protein L32 [Fibrocapsa japonica]UTE95106.1 ribosomal protein L32 [Fibrocapsa japonica]
MAVPKKRTSKSKKNSRKSHWFKKANIVAKRVLSSAKGNANIDWQAWTNKKDKIRGFGKIAKKN